MNPLLWPALVLIPAPSPQATTLADAVAVKAEVIAGCGIFTSWGMIDFVHKGETIRVYSLCAMEEELPRIGARCTITFHTRQISGIVPRAPQTPFTGNALDKMTCDPPAEAAHHEYRAAMILNYGPLPPHDGSIGVHTRPVRVRTADGETHILHFVHGFWNDTGVPIVSLDKERRPYPLIGATCDVFTSASQRYHGAVRKPRPDELIYRIDC